MKLSLLALMMFLSAGGPGKLPSFRIGLLNGTYFSSGDMHLKKPLLFIYFDPACEECQAFTRLLKGDRQVFQKYQVLMVTNTDLSSLKRFAREYKLDQQKGLILGTEGWTRTLQRALGISRFPYVAVYGSNRQFMLQVTAPAAKDQFEKLKASLK